MAFVYLIYAIAILISAVAAYFSIVGLAALFAATFWGVVIMAGSLEIGKIVSTKWVYSNWRNPSAPWHFRGLFCFFIAILMAITSLGIYGYLSKGHLEQNAPLAGLSIQANQLETQLKQKQVENEQLLKRLDQNSRITDKSLERSDRAGLRAANQQRSDNAKIQNQIDENNDVINKLNEQLIPLKTQSSEVEAKLGPLKYVAELLGMEKDAAVRLVIVLIMLAFDPLALALFVAASIAHQSVKAQRAPKTEITELPIETTEPEVATIEEKVETDEAAEPTEPAIAVVMEPTAEAIEFNEETFQPELFDDDYRRGFQASIQSDVESELEEYREQRRIEIEKDLREQEFRLDKRYEEAQTPLASEVVELEQSRAQLISDVEELQKAHKMLLDMQDGINVELGRIADEKKLLNEWNEQLIAQQHEINNWRPVDSRTPRQKIIDMLSENPEFINEIVSIVDAIRPHNPPGL